MAEQQAQDPSASDFMPVCSIGASAGGVGALQSFVCLRNPENPMVDDLRGLPGVSSAEAEALLIKAVRCRRLAAQSLDSKAAEALKALALECETKAAEIALRIRR